MMEILKEMFSNLIMVGAILSYSLLIVLMGKITSEVLFLIADFKWRRK